MKLVPFKILHVVSYLSSIVTMAVSVAICEIFGIKKWCDLEKMAPFDRSHISSISLP